MCLGFVRNFGSFFAVRALLGLAEGGLLPGMVLYLSGLYTRTELALRIGIFYTAASLSGAFGGQSSIHGPSASGLRLTYIRPSRSRAIGHCAQGRPRRMEVDFHHRGSTCERRSMPYHALHANPFTR